MGALNQFRGRSRLSKLAASFEREGPEIKETSRARLTRLATLE